MPPPAQRRRGGTVLLVVCCAAGLAGALVGGPSGLGSATAAPAATPRPMVSTGSRTTPASLKPASPSPPPGATPSRRPALVVTHLVRVSVVPAAPKAGGTIRVRGRLVDPKGQGIPGQVVMLGSIGSGGYPAPTMTAADGSFEVGALVPPGTPPGRVGVTLAFQGDAHHVPSDLVLVVAVAPGGAGVVIPPALQAPPAQPANPGDPAPAPTLIRPPDRTPLPASAPAPTDRALPAWLLWTLGAVALAGLTAVVAVVGRVRRGRHEDYDSFIAPADDH